MLIELKKNNDVEFSKELEKHGYLIVEKDTTFDEDTNEASEVLLTLKADTDRLINLDDEWLPIQFIGYSHGYVVLPVKAAKIREHATGRDVVVEVLCVPKKIIDDLDVRMSAYQSYLFEAQSASSDSQILHAFIHVNALSLEADILSKEVSALNHCEAYRFHIDTDSAARRYTKIKQKFYEVRSTLEGSSLKEDAVKLAYRMFN